MNTCKSAFVVLLGLLSAPGIAQEQFALQMKYTAGEQRPMRVTFTGIGTLTIEGPGAPNQPTDLWMNGDIELAQEIKSVDERGTGDIEMKLTKFDAQVQFMGMRQDIVVEDDRVLVMMNDKVVFDSLDPEQAKKNPMLELIGQGFIVRQDRTGKIVGLPQLELILKMMLPDSDFQGAMERSTGPLPAGLVKVGDTWEERQVWPYGAPEGEEPPAFVTLHKFAEVVNVAGHKCAKITSTSNINLADVSLPMPTLMPGMGGQGPTQMSLVINKMVMDLASTGHFDIERGVPLSADSALTLNMEMTQRIKLPPPPQEGQQEAEGPEEPQEVEITVSIEDFAIDIAMELAQ